MDTTPDTKPDGPVNVAAGDLENALSTMEELTAEALELERGKSFALREGARPSTRQRTIRKLSVLMPLYNERWTVEEVIERVLQNPVPLDVELIVVDDGSTDGSFEVVQALAAQDKRIRVFRHERNRGKGAAIRTAIEHLTGDVTIIQDADLEYDPREYPRLLEPIVQGKADAVYGSRFAGHPRRVLLFWHSLANWMLTTLSNMFNDLNLTDMETCYKMVRTDVLRQLRLTSDTFTFEPELTCRLAQWGARIYEVPISYCGRTFQEGKKIRARDGLKAIAEIIRCRHIDTRFTNHTGMYVLKSVARASNYNRWLMRQCQPFLGARVLEAGAGIGNLSQRLIDSQRLVLADHDPVYVAHLSERFGQRRNVRAVQMDLTRPDDFDKVQDEALDTVFCSNVLEHLSPDLQVLECFHRTLIPGGHCVIVVPAGPWLYTDLDRDLGHYRRYTPGDLCEKLQRVGFDVVYSKRFCRLGALAWWFNGKVLRKRHLTPRQMIWFDRLLPLTRLLDCFLPVRGMSMIMVGRKPNVRRADST